MDQRVPVVRTLEQDIGSGQFRPKFSESINSKYELAVEASQYSEDRMAFQFQAVGSQLVLNPEVFIDFTLVVSGKGALEESLADMPVLRAKTATGQHLRANGVAAEGYGNLIAFGPGDALSESISSIQVTCNSASITSTERDKFWRSLMRCWVSDETTTKIFEKGSGGAPESYDARPVSVLQVGGTVSYGKTMESSLQRRAQQFIRRSVPLVGDANTWSKEVQVRWPVTAGLFHPYSEAVFTVTPRLRDYRTEFATIHKDQSKS